MNVLRHNVDDLARAAERLTDGARTGREGNRPEGSADYSHLAIQGWTGISRTQDAQATPTVVTETQYGWEEKVSLAVPLIVELGASALGGTGVSPVSDGRHWHDASGTQQWEHAAIGAALAGVSVSCGPEVWRGTGKMPVAPGKMPVAPGKMPVAPGKMPVAPGKMPVPPGEMPVASNTGKMPAAPALERIVEAFDRYHRGQGELLVQVDDEDVRRGVPEYLIKKHRLRTIELAWTHGAADNGDPIRIGSLERALAFQRQGYTIVPDPSDLTVQECFEDGLIAEFERHGRLGVQDEAGFLATCQRLRGLGFQRIALRTDVAGLRELAMTLKWASQAEIDLLTLDRTGTVAEVALKPDLCLHAAAAEFAARLAAKGQRVPDLALAGGFRDDEQVFKALALGAPFVKAVQVDGIAAGVVAAFNRFGRPTEDFFAGWEQIAELVGKREAGNVPTAAIGVFARVERLAAGLRRIMSATRCFSPAAIGRQHLTSLTRECTEVTGIPCAANAYRAEAEAILDR